MPPETVARSPPATSRKPSITGSDERAGEWFEMFEMFEGACLSAELIDELKPYLLEDLGGHPWSSWMSQDQSTTQRMPGAISRWSAGKNLAFVPLDPKLVVEVAYDHMEGNRFRHTAQFRRWRTDRTPESCTYEQLETPVGYNLDDIQAR